VTTRRIREFVSRDWAAARAAKDRYWRERVEQLGPAEAFRIADELRRQVIAHDPAWPHRSERSEDLSSHVRVAALLRRAGSARRR
jgi:hypothetical protein